MSGALEARQIRTGDGRLTAEVVGEIELDGRVLVVKRINANFRLRLEPDKRETALRVLEIYADFCPMARSSKGCVGIASTLDMEDL